jgi:Dyp-type peroxidase family
LIGLLNRHQVDQRDLQGNMLCGYGNDFAWGSYLFFQIEDAEATRRWLTGLCDEVTDAVPWPAGWKPLTTLNVALSATGLAALELPEKVLLEFPEAFREGMADRADVLGDRDASEPRKWVDELRRPQLLVTVMAQSEAARDERVEQLRRSGPPLAYRQDSGLLIDDAHPSGYAREHFGFADGFSQPAIRGNAGPNTRRGMGTPLRFGRWREVAPGEFVLGYEGEDRLLPVAPPSPLGQSGSYMVWRKLKQDVDGFRDYLREAAAGPLGLTEQALAAKMVGRWQDGRSLVVSDQPPVPAGPAPNPDTINDFLYGTGPAGGCPVGAHVRRANPRDSLGYEGRLVKRHRIIRRGMPYTDEDERGLVFVCYQADIVRQFELIQSSWLLDGDPFWLGPEPDPLTMGGSQGRMTIPGRPPHYLPSLASFVTTRGGGYFFVPGLAALRALASAYWR